MIDLIIESPTCSRGIACQMPRNLSCTFPRLRSATLFHAKASIHFWFMCVYIERVILCKFSYSAYAAIDNDATDRSLFSQRVPSPTNT